MPKIKLLFSSIFSLAIIFSALVILISFQLRFVLTSFKINSNGIPQPVINFYPKVKTDSTISQITRIKLNYGIFEDSGYTLGFSIKTKNQNQKESLLFYSTDRHLSSTYWNISLVDGKIETSRIEHIPPVITSKKINDDKWHEILIATDSNKEEVFIDNKKDITTSVNYLKTPDKWFVVEINPKLTNNDQIYLKDFVFINKVLSPKEFQAYAGLFQDNSNFLSRLVFFQLFKNIITILLVCSFLLFLIKINYPHFTLYSILKNILGKPSLFLLATVSLWTSYGYQISLLCFFVFLYLILKDYEKILPDYLKDFINFPVSFIFTSLALLRRLKLKGFLRHLTTQKPETYFLLFLFLGLFLSFNRFLFTNNLFR